FEAAVQIQTAAFGRDHWRVANNLASLGTSLDQAGEQRRALGVFREAADILERIAPPENGPRLYAEQSLGQALTVHEQCDEGVTLMSRVTETLANGSEEDPRLPAARWALGICQGQLGRADDARKTLTLALDTIKGPAPDRAGVMLDLARVEHKLGASQQAMERLRDAVALLADADTGAVATVDAQLLWAKIEVDSGAQVDGLKRAGDVLALIGKKPLAAHRQVSALVGVAEVLADAGDLREARGIAEQAGAIVQKSKLAATIATPTMARLRDVMRRSGGPVGAP
ncbi:MAG: tetratricopeptide repeat protein, partial [Nannocystaceae bacterium]|nr:tetratricopeptide repeat protein [Nannocystaceae bacterium]